MYLFFLYLFFLWLAVQNVVLPWVYRQRLLPADVVGILMASKEVVLALALCVLAYRCWKKESRLMTPDKFALAYTALLVLYLVGGPWFLGGTAGFALRIISMRSLVSLALFYFWGRLSFLTLQELRQFLWFVVVLQTCVALFGFYEWLFLPTAFWSDTVGLGPFMLDIKGLLENRNVVDGLPSNMFQSGMRRLISTYAEPLAMGIASVFPLLVCVAAYLRTSFSATIRKSLFVVGMIIAAALLLTIGRESIAAAGLGVLALFWFEGKLRHSALPMAMFGVALLFLPQVWNYIADTVNFREASAATHLRYLYSGWQQMPDMMLGKGLGEAGGWAFSLAGVQSEVGENSYFELMSQAGILSVVLMIGFLFTLAKATLHYSRKFPDPFISASFVAAACHIVARCLAGTFSPSLFAVVPLASFFFFCGAGFTAVQRAVDQPVAVVKRLLILQRSA